MTFKFYKQKDQKYLSATATVPNYTKSSHKPIVFGGVHLENFFSINDLYIIDCKKSQADVTIYPEMHCQENITICPQEGNKTIKDLPPAVHQSLPSAVHQSLPTDVQSLQCVYLAF